MPRPGFQLYMIGDRKQCAGRSLSEVVRSAAEAGVQAFQFREKDLSLKAQFELAAEIRQITKSFGMKLLINDRVDLCLALDAEGVHLPASGLPVPAARALLGPDKLIGASCHSEEDAQQAEAGGADFAVLGPVYDTPSKRAFGAPIGLPEFRRIREGTHLPLFAIGGIRQNRVQAVLSAGADGIAVISALGTADDVAAECRSFLQEMACYSKSAEA